MRNIIRNIVAIPIAIWIILWQIIFIITYSIEFISLYPFIKIIELDNKGKGIEKWRINKSLVKLSDKLEDIANGIHF